MDDPLGCVQRVLRARCYCHLRMSLPLELFQYLLLRPGQLPKLIEETFLALAFAPETLIGLIAALAPHDRQRQ